VRIQYTSKKIDDDCCVVDEDDEEDVYSELRSNCKEIYALTISAFTLLLSHSLTLVFSFKSILIVCLKPKISPNSAPLILTRFTTKKKEKRIVFIKK